MNARRLIPLLVFIAALPVDASAQSPDGRTVMERVLSGEGWSDMTARVTLTIQDARGQQRVRTIEMSSRERTADETDLLMRFVSPADVRGTGFLILEHADRDDDRYLYLPAMRRTRRIASSGKGGNFMGSDFTYYDIGKPRIEDWTYTTIGTGTLDGVECLKVEARPATDEVEKDTGYSRVVHWVDPARWTILRSEYADRLGEPWKVLTVPGLEKIKDVWFQTDLVMEDVQERRTSRFVFDDIKIDQGLSADLFTTRNLERWR